MLSDLTINFFHIFMKAGSLQSKFKVNSPDFVRFCPLRCPFL